MRWMRFTALALAAAACGGSSVSGGDPVVLLGRWTLNHEFVLLGQNLATCPGEMNVTSNAGSSFSGTFSILAGTECAGAARDGTMSGTIAGTAISFTVQGLGVEELLEAAGCQIVSATGFRGSASETSLQATDTQTFSCVDPETGAQVPVQLQWQVTGQKAAA